MRLNYTVDDNGKNSLYSDKKVLFIVPHQDDELNIGIGVLDEFVRYNSDIYIAYVTNGDYRMPAEERFAEAIAADTCIGVPEDHILFLGYGDSWEDASHLYNTPDGAVLSSHAGHSETYGTSSHPAFQEGNLYTHENYLSDIKNMILSIRPDLIFCTDYDAHLDHKGLTLAFDTVIGQILHEEFSYHPVIFKGYAYGTAWYADADYFSANIKSTENLFADPYYQQPISYDWADRVRFPVFSGILSRSLFHSSGYMQCSFYRSQYATQFSAGMINGDKVFWERDTNSICYKANVTCSSGDSAVLTDFKIIDNCNIADSNRMPYDGVWIPSSDDRLKEVKIFLDQKSDISKLVLYDSPDPNQNILNALITFDNGTSIETGTLNSTGCATEITTEQKDISWFTIRLISTEGVNAGLTEVEAFSSDIDSSLSFIKLMNADGDFTYDYIIDSSSEETFYLYRYGVLPSLNSEHYDVFCSNPSCSAEIADEGIVVSCPAGEKSIVTVQLKGSTVSDSFSVQNPGKLYRSLLSALQQYEEHVYNSTHTPWYRNSIVYRLLVKIENKIV